jgi:hypothetical protein
MVLSVGYWVWFPEVPQVRSQILQHCQPSLCCRMYTHLQCNSRRITWIT